MEDITLSHKDSCRFDEITRDRKAADATLSTTLAFHQNSINQLTKSNRTLWNHVIETHNLDDTVEYTSRWSVLDRRYIVSKAESD